MGDRAHLDDLGQRQQDNAVLGGFRQFDLRNGILRDPAPDPLLGKLELGMKDAPDVAPGLQRQRLAGLLILEAENPVVNFLGRDARSQPFGKGGAELRPD